MGDIIKASEIRGRESLDDTIDVLMGTEKDMQMFSFYNNLKQASVRNTKVEWQDDGLRSDQLEVTASASGADWDTNDDTTALPVTAGDGAKLKVGDLLRLPTGPEVVRVTAINSATSIDVTRGVGGTASAQGSAAFDVTKTSNAQDDGSDPVDPAPTDPTERYNYIQIIEDPLHISTETQMKHISTEAERERQKMLALKNCIKDLDKAILLGRRYEATDVRAMGGLREWASTTSNVSGSITKAKFYTALIAMIDAGGMPDQLHAGPTVMGYIEQLFDSDLEPIRNDYNVTVTVKVVNILGVTIRLYMNRGMLAEEFMLVDSSRVEVVYMEGNGINGQFAVYEIDKNGKQIKDHVVGFYSLKVKNPAAALCRVYGITGVA